MSNRERWTIYPLLFLSLAMSLKTQLVARTGLNTPFVECESLVCETLVVRNDEGKGVAAIGTSSDGTGIFELFDGKDQRVFSAHADPNVSGGTVQVFGRGKPLVTLLATGDAGTIATQNSGGRTLVQLVHDGGQTGTIATYGTGILPNVVMRSESGGGVLRTQNDSGVGLAALTSNEGTSGVLQLHGEQGGASVTMGSLDGAGVVQTFNEAGESMVQLRHRAGQTGAVVVGGLGGHSLFLFADDGNGSALPLVYDARGRPFLFLVQPLSARLVPQPEQDAVDPAEPPTKPGSEEEPPPPEEDEGEDASADPPE